MVLKSSSPSCLLFTNAIAVRKVNAISIRKVNTISIRKTLPCVRCRHFLMQRLLGLVLRDSANNFDLVRDILKGVKDLPIPINETEFRIRKALLLRELFDEDAGSAEVVAR